MGLAGILQFFAQKVEVNAQIIRMVNHFGAPNLAQDVSLGQDQSGVADEKVEEGVLSSGQSHDLFADLYDATLQVDEKAAGSEDFERGRRCVPPGGAQPGGQLFNVERTRDEVTRAVIENVNSGNAVDPTG
jgi:hypothetical protein